MAILTSLCVTNALKSFISLDSRQFLGKLVLKFRETAHFHLAYSGDLLLISTDHALCLCLLRLAGLWLN